MKTEVLNSLLTLIDEDDEVKQYKLVSYSSLTWPKLLCVYLWSTWNSLALLSAPMVRLFLNESTCYLVGKTRPA